MPNDSSSTLRIAIDVPLDRAAAFALLLDELPTALAISGVQLDAGPEGAVSENGATCGRIIDWQPGERMLIEWHPAPWEPHDVAEIDLRFETVDGSTRVTLEHRRFGSSLGGPAEQFGWFASQVLAPFFRAASPTAMGDWLTDRRARRPSGAQSRAFYGAPLYHFPMFRVILAELRLTSDDFLLEVGCGGGALLRDALRSGCRAAAVDHSADMVRLACAQNAEAIAAGRLQIRQASADALPFENDTFTCATMTGVFGFLGDPVGALGEIHRVLLPGGRIVIAGADPELRGTPGAPEPMASRLHFHDDEETERIGREAGFASARVLRVNLQPHARDVGIPAEHLALFDGASRFLVATKETATA